MGKVIQPEIFDESQLKIIKAKLKGLTIQDVCVVLACLTVVFLLRARETFNLIPLWRKEFNTLLYRNSKYPTSDEILPLPVITDLESDGVTEIVMVTNILTLEIHVSPYHQEKSLPYSELQKSQKLHIEKFSSTTFFHPKPVVLTTGFIDDYNTTITEQRKQVIIVAFLNQGLLCYDSDLNLMWHKELVEDFQEAQSHYETKNLAVLITSYNLEKEDRGSVFVTASMKHTHSENQKARLSPKKRPQMHQMGSHMHTVEQSDDVYTHFSTFALNAEDGSFRWKHAGKECESAKKVTAPPNFKHWKLSIQNRENHAGEVHWTKHQDHMYHNMPHHWRELSDTGIKLIDLKKSTKNPHHHSHQSLGKAASFSPLVDILGLEDDHIAGLPFGGMKPHNPHEHLKTPSSILNHFDQGMELLQLDTGNTITRVKIEDPKCVYLDLEENGSLESICLQQADVCVAKAHRIVPASQELFTMPLCEVPSMFGPVSFMAVIQSHKYIGEDERLAMPPLVVKSIGKRHGIFAHLMGRKLKSEQKGYDSVFVTSSGRMSSYSPHGALNWQVLISSGWTAYHMGEGAEYELDIEERQYTFQNTFKPSLSPYSLLTFSKVTHTLMLGWNSLSLVDLYDGNVALEHSVPCAPLQKPVIGDVNDDGRNDIIIYCSFGYLALTLEPQKNHLYNCVTAVLVISVIVLLVWCCKAEDQEEENSDEHTSKTS